MHAILQARLIQLATSTQQHRAHVTQTENRVRKLKTQLDRAEQVTEIETLARQLTQAISKLRTLNSKLNQEQAAYERTWDIADKLTEEISLPTTAACAWNINGTQCEKPTVDNSRYCKQHAYRWCKQCQLHHATGGNSPRAQLCDRCRKEQQ
ncbi:hypothetical protein GCM10007377_15730 [Galliscardovia ingluviei]|uniref:Uncharacterized protein n=1 Tax=Galliscardovia ingluviei TaxID=1769422 RepID=A0A8J3AKL6_9BIFI|nr:hypothetical protein GCM10007377_15730 [Galliscardovia ingluviei]